LQPRGVLLKVPLGVTLVMEMEMTMERAIEVRMAMTGKLAMPSEVRKMSLSSMLLHLIGVSG